MQLESGMQTKETWKELYQRIDILLKQKERVIVAIEGGSASGKTTLGNHLKECYHCNLLHMDDFFLRPWQRSRERLAEIGGNVDYERFLDEVIIPLKKGDRIEYRRFDCQTLTIQPAVWIWPERLTIVEGVYSTHPKFGTYFDLSVFLNICPKVQKERILKRNTPEKAERFFKEWIPMEHRYFEGMQVKERCNIMIEV